MKALLGVALSLLLGGAAGAAPGDRAMVLTAKGAVLDGKSLTAGQTLADGAQFKIDANGEAVLLDLVKGQRVRISGPSSVKLSAGRIEASKGSLQAVASPKTSLSPSGQNFRRLGGSITRSRSLRPAQLSASERFHDFRVEGRDGDIWASFNLDGEKSPVKVILRKEPLRAYINNQDRKTIFFEEAVDEPEIFVAALEKGSNYRVKLGALTPSRTYGLSISQGDDLDGLIIQTRFRALTPEQTVKLRESLATLEASAKQHPKDITQYITAVGVLDDLDQLPQALIWVDRALKIEPKNNGLRSLQLRLLIDAGNYAQAAKLIAQGVTW